MRGGPGKSGQRGMSLVITMLMLIAVMLLGISAAQIALSSEKASRNDRDRQVAFQAAEAALLDAELDIEGSTSTLSRSANFSRDSALGFPAASETECATEANPNSLGLCARQPDGSTPAWQSINFSDVAPATARSVPYGKFTGQTFSVGLGGTTPIIAPRYIIELMTYNAPGQRADVVTYFYRLTAIGYGRRDTTRVVLQTFYRKES